MNLVPRAPAPSVNRGGSKGGLGGIKPSYLPKINGYPPKPLLHFWEEGMKK